MNLSALAATLPAPSVALMLTAIVAFAGLLRGFTGFGFAMFAVPLATLMIDPARVVTVVLALQFAAGLQTSSTDWHEIDRRSVVGLALAAVPFSLVGSWALGVLDERPVRLVIGIATVAGAVLLWRADVRARPRPSPLATAATGAASGVLHGLLAMGGPPLTLFFLRGAFAPQVARASMTGIFLLMSVGPLLGSIVAGRFDAANLWLIALLLPTMLFSTWVGSRLFRLAPGRHRGVSLPLLAAVGLIATWNALR
jgi:uncharacterized membrane protein YfcA